MLGEFGSPLWVGRSNGLNRPYNYKTMNTSRLIHTFRVGSLESVYQNSVTDPNNWWKIYQDLSRKIVLPLKSDSLVQSHSRIHYGRGTIHFYHSELVMVVCMKFTKRWLPSLKLICRKVYGRSRENVVSPTRCPDRPNHGTLSHLYPHQVRPQHSQVRGEDVVGPFGPQTCSTQSHKGIRLKRPYWELRTLVS